MKSHIIFIAALVLLTVLDIGESGYGSGYGHGYGYGYGQGYGYGGYRNRYRYHYYGKRGMKKMASRQRANNIHTELKDDAGIEHLKENFAEIERNKAQLKAAH